METNDTNVYKIPNLIYSDSVFYSIWCQQCDELSMTTYRVGITLYVSKNTII